MSDVIDEIKGGDRRAAARLITALERWDQGALQILFRIRSTAPLAHRIVFTGPPGVGKSTLIDLLVSCYRSRNESESPEGWTQNSIYRFEVLGRENADLMQF